MLYIITKQKLASKRMIVDLKLTRAREDEEWHQE